MAANLQRKGTIEYIQGDKTPVSDTDVEGSQIALYVMMVNESRRLKEESEQGFVSEFTDKPMNNTQAYLGVALEHLKERFEL